MLNKVYLTILMMTIFLVFTGCSGQKLDRAMDSNQAEEKTGDTLLSGTLFVQLERKYLKDVVEKPQQTIEVDSYSVDLEPFSGKKIQVKGQYSGDTLFVSEIMELE
jgi:hypothetical protein